MIWQLAIIVVLVLLFCFFVGWALLLRWMFGVAAKIDFAHPDGESDTGEMS